MFIISFCTSSVLLGHFSVLFHTDYRGAEGPTNVHRWMVLQGLTNVHGQVEESISAIGWLGFPLSFPWFSHEKKNLHFFPWKNLHFGGIFQPCLADFWGGPATMKRRVSRFPRFAFQLHGNDMIDIIICIYYIYNYMWRFPKSWGYPICTSIYRWL